MKIQVTGGERDLNLTIPTGLLLNRLTIGIAGTAAKKYAPEAIKGLSPEAVKRLMEELRRIKKKHGAWELVEVQSADGEYVKITL